MKESTIRKQILDYLNSLSESHFIINRPGADSGEADITGCIKGRRCEFEVKKPGEKARKLQLHKLDLWHNAGAVAAVVNSIEEVQNILRVNLLSTLTWGAVMKKSIRCPYCQKVFNQRQRESDKVFRNTIQHHLWMSHNIEVIQSHKETDSLIEGTSNETTLSRT